MNETSASIPQEKNCLYELAHHTLNGAFKRFVMLMEISFLQGNQLVYTLSDSARVTSKVTSSKPVALWESRTSTWMLVSPHKKPISDVKRGWVRLIKAFFPLFQHTPFDKKVKLLQFHP